MPAGLRKRKQQISEEIPKRGGTHGEDLAEVEVPFQFAVEQPYCQRVDAQTYHSDTEVFRIFHPDLRVGALEGPPAVEEVVGRGGENESQDVAQVFVPLQPFLAHVCDPEVDKHAREAHYAEFQELQ